VGDTEKVPDVLLVIRVPPHEPLNNCQLAPVPSEPPLTVIVEAPEHITDGVAVSDVGATEFVFRVTVTETQAVILQSPSART